LSPVINNADSSKARERKTENGACWYTDDDR